MGKMKCSAYRVDPSTPICANHEGALSPISCRRALAFDMATFYPCVLFQVFP